MFVVRTPVDKPLFSVNKICLSTVYVNLFFPGREVGVQRIWDRVIGVSKSQGRATSLGVTGPSIPQHK